MNVLVTSAKGAKGLIITRSLGKKKIDVINTDYNKFSAAFYSRYSKDHFLSPSPAKSPEDFITTIFKYIKNNKTNVLMPVNSIETLLISKYKDRFTPYVKLPIDDYSKMIKLHDKEEFAKIAENLNLPIPRTYTIVDINDIKAKANIFDYPVVIKLKQSTSSIGISYAFSKEEFILKYKATIEKFKLDPIQYPIVQEYIHGTGCGVSLLMNHGELRALFTHKRLREYPITGGPSTLRVSIKHHEMERIAVKLMKYFNWHGLAMIEFKLDERTNKPYLIEVNPRFWGSINQAIASGVDFPYLLYKMAVEGDIQPVLEYKLGVKTRFLMHDFRALCSQLKSSNNHIQVINEFMKFNGVVDDIVSFKDPLPAIFYTFSRMNELFSRGE